MAMLSDLRYRLRALFRRHAVETELDQELHFHLEKEVEKYMRSGMTEEESRRRARLAFGGDAQIKEDCRDARGTGLIETTLQDVRYALRQLRENPVFAAVMVLTLALSIGANSAIFSVIYSVLLRSLPYPQADKLTRIFMSTAAFPKFPLNPFDFRDIRARNRSFESMAAYTRSDMQLASSSGGAIRVNGFRLTAGFFHVLGIEPELGREFDTNSEIPGNELQVILSDRLWRVEYGADPKIIGRKVTLNAQPFTVVGVMPPGTAHPGNKYHAVSYGEDVDVWTPFTFEGDPSQRGSHYIEAIARLKDGVSAGGAQAEVFSIMNTIAHEHGNEMGQWRMLVVPLDREIVGPNRQMLLVLLGAVTMVLLIACANAANLLLARAAARQRELAVRTALGASRARLVRQLLTESLLLALTGGALGLVLALGGVKGFISLLPSDFPRLHEIRVSAAVFLFTLTISSVTGILFGLVPALQASRIDPRRGLHEGGHAATGGAKMSRLRDALVVAEVSLACVLLVGAGLMFRSLLNLLHLDPGFEQQHVLTANLWLPGAAYKTMPERSRFYERLATELESIPGVSSAGLGSDLPWTGWDDNASFSIEARQPPPHQDFGARYHVATWDYFRALGIPLIRGRFFTREDNADGPKVIVINQALANLYWPKGDALGKRITFDDHPKDSDWLTIVGVIGDVKDKPESANARPAFWWSALQAPFSQISVVVRANADPQVLTRAVRAAVHRIDPSLAVAELRWMDEVADVTVATPRFAFVLVGIFAGLAILLAAIGTYGVIAYSVSRRTSEFGLRMALGARRMDVVLLVLRQAAMLTLSGAVLGMAFALLAGRVLKSMIYEVNPSDPLIFSAAGVFVIAMALTACWLPARKATKADPMIALRAE
jgi:predicted permease